MAAHDKTCAVTAAVVTAAMLLARWRATARHRSQHRYDTAEHTAWHRLKRVKAWYHAWYGDTNDGGRAGRTPAADELKTHSAVRHAEELLEQYWRELRPLYLSQEERPQR